MHEHRVERKTVSVPGEGDHFKMTAVNHGQRRCAMLVAQGECSIERQGNGGERQQREKVKRWQQGEINKRMKDRKKEVERSRETEREMDIQRFPHSLTASPE